MQYLTLEYFYWYSHCKESKTSVRVPRTQYWIVSCQELFVNSSILGYSYEELKKMGVVKNLEIEKRKKVN